MPLLRRLAVSEVPAIRRDPVDPKAREIAEPIVEAVRVEGEPALRRYAEQFGELRPGAKLIYQRDDLKAAWDGIGDDERACLLRTMQRIRAFAAAQKATVREMSVQIPGGKAGHTVSPVEAAGCYAPGGRYPLPSTVLMTATTARVAGCSRVVVASPRPTQMTLAAAFIAEADILIPVGGAHAIAALAYGAGPIAACDAVVGPGNMFVTAAKSLVSGRVAIDMLAGPSECLVIADDAAKPALVAADLLAQAEHDPSALPALICLSDAFAEAVEKEVAQQLAVLPTSEIASQSLKNGYTVVVPTIDAAAELSDRLAVEHVELHTEDHMELMHKLKHYGGLFVGEGAAEVLGDYGAGPNHTLPTGGTARSYGGLSVFTFLRVRTWMSVDDATEAYEMVSDGVRLGEMEGLLGHAHAAKLRLREPCGGVIAPRVAPNICTKSMNMQRERLHIAIPKKGRMSEKCVKFLEAAGLEYTRCFFPLTSPFFPAHFPHMSHPPLSPYTTGIPFGIHQTRPRRCGPRDESADHDRLPARGGHCKVRW